MSGKRPPKSRAHKQGLPPGTPVYLGEEREGAVRITLIDYDETNVVETPIESADQCLPFKDKRSVTWINVDGVHDAAMIQTLAERLGLHPLVHEDILSTGQRPKVEDYEEYLYLVLKMIRWDGVRSEATFEQVSILLGRGLVVSFQERPGDVFEPVRQRIRSAKGRIRTMGADYLAHNLLDAIVDGYFVVLEQRGEQIEQLENEVISRPSPKTLGQIHRLKREGLLFRRAVWPVRELVAGLERTGSPLVGDALRPYLRDLYDHTVQVIDTSETFRDMLSGLLDTYLSSLSNRMNEVMKVLTVIATIFIPLTFIAGVYGMNFEAMPELHWRWGYATVLVTMAAVALGMAVYIKKKKWM